jgi:hypothetical protein
VSEHCPTASLGLLGTSSHDDVEIGGTNVFRDLLDKIGTARMEVVGDDAGKTWTIILPQYHPGYDARTDQSTSFRRLYFLCWIQVWVYIDTALNVLTSEPNLTEGRYSLCQYIMACAEARLEAVGFKNALSNAKKAFAERLSNKARAQAKRPFSETDSTAKPSSQALMQLVAEKSAYLERLDRFPKTFGEPGSQQRAKLANNQWVTNNQELQTALKMFTKQEWKSYATNLPAGYYVPVCLDALKDSTNLPQAIQGLFHEKALERNADIAMMTTDVRCEMLQAIAQDMVQDRERSKKIKKRKEEVYDINAVDKIDLATWTGKSRFKCEGVDGSVRRIIFPNNRSLLRRKSQFSRRMLEFRDDGISVKNEHGQVIYPSDSPKVGVGIPINQLDEFAENLKWLWEQAMAVRTPFNLTTSTDRSWVGETSTCSEGPGQ